MYCLLLVINVAARTISCPNLGYSAPIAVPKVGYEVKPGTYGIGGFFVATQAIFNGKRLPASTVGNKQIGLTNGGMIHETNQPNSIGRAASHGCFRIGNIDFLFRTVLPSTIVRIERCIAT